MRSPDLQSTNVTEQGAPSCPHLMDTYAADLERHADEQGYKERLLDPANFPCQYRDRCHITSAIKLGPIQIGQHTMCLLRHHTEGGYKVA